MKVKILSLILIVCLLLTGCDWSLTIREPGEDDDKVIFRVTGSGDKSDPDSNLGEGFTLNGVWLGMSPKEFLKAMDALDIELYMPDYDYEYCREEYGPVIEDGRSYNLVDNSFFYTAEKYNLYFVFTPEGALCQIICRDRDIDTAEGLSLGSRVLSMETIYGTDYKANVDGLPVYQYKLPAGYLNVFVNEYARVFGWILSSYPEIVITGDPRAGAFTHPAIP